MQKLRLLSLIGTLIVAMPFCDAKAKAKSMEESSAPVAKKSGAKKGYTEISSAAEYEKMLKSHHGVIVIKFYAPWCTYCKQMEPEYAKVAQAMGGDNVIFLAINADKKNAELSDIASSFGVTGFPTTIVMNKHAGYMDGSKIAEEVNYALGRGNLPKAMEEKEKPMAKARNK